MADFSVCDISDSLHDISDDATEISDFVPKKPARVASLVVLDTYRGMPWRSKLKEMLDGVRWSRAKLAKTIGVAPSTMHSWINGGQGPPLDKAIVIAKVLDVTLDAWCRPDRPTPKASIQGRIVDELRKEVEKARSRRRARTKKPLRVTRAGSRSKHRKVSDR